MTRLRAAGYLRVATRFQAEEGESLAKQRAQIQAYCDARSLELVRIYEDAGQSGMTTDRPGLQALLQAASEHNFDEVVVTDNLRLSRSALDFLRILDVLKKSGVDIKEAGGISQ